MTGWNQLGDDVREKIRIEHVVDVLTAEFADIRSQAEVESAVADVLAELAEARIRDFVPNLVERAARERLRRDDRQPR
ncbi:MAG TPA: hypothetical protein VI011_20085 [Asanoa sp.]